MWNAALHAGADMVTITSYNEWGEGTQIEPAGHGGRYESYDGAYGCTAERRGARISCAPPTGPHASKKTSAPQPETSASNTSSTPRRDGCARSTTDVVPLLETKRTRSFVGTEAEQRLGRDDVTTARLPARDSLELAQLFERIDPDVRVGADAEADAARRDALDGQEAVAEVRLRRRAHADAGSARPSRSSSAPSACVAWTIVVRSVRHPVRSSSSIGRMPCSAMHSSISRGCSSACTCSGSFSRGGVAAELLEPVRGTCAHGVGGDADGDPAAAQILQLADVLGRRILAKAGQAAACVGGEQQHDCYSSLRRRVDRCERFVEPEIVKLPTAV